MIIATIALIVAAGGFIFNVWSRHSDKADRQGDEHVNTLIDAKVTPSDWLTELATAKLFESLIQKVLDGVKTDLEVRLQKLRARYDRKTARHTFVFAVWHEDQPKIFILTNYESLDDGDDLVEGNDAVTQISFVPLPEAPVTGTG